MSSPVPFTACSLARKAFCPAAGNVVAKAGGIPRLFHKGARGWSRRALTLFGFIAVAWCTGPQTVAAQPDAQAGDPFVQVYDLDKTDGFAVVRLNGKDVKNAELASDHGILRYSFRRKGMPILAHHEVLLTGMSELRLRLRTEEGTTLLFAVEDRDGDSFTFVTEIETSDWQTLVLTPDDFVADKRNKGQTKHRIDPDRLGSTYAIVDLSSPLFQRGSNVIELDTVEVRTRPIEVRKGPLVVDGPMTLTGAMLIDGDIEVRPGGHLNIKADRLVLNGAMTVEDGTVSMVDTSLRVTSQFTHEHSWQINGTSSFEIRDSVIALDDAIEVDPSGVSRFAMAGTKTSGVFTVTSKDKASVRLQDTRGGGEFIICGTCPFRADNADYFLLWLVLGPNLGEDKTLTLPDGTLVENWSAGTVADAQITGSKGVLWGLITAPGARGTIQGSDILAVASVYGGPGQTLISGIRTGELPHGEVFDTGDRSLRFVDSTVRAWNFYTTQGHDLVIEDSTVGEAWGLDGTGSVTLRRSILDGSGGTLQARGTTRFLLEGVTVLSQLIAQDQAQIVIKDSDVREKLTATGEAVIRLVNTTVSGETQAFPPAQIIQE